MKKFYSNILFVLFLASCNTDSIHIYSLDDKNSLTIINDGDLRYIISGDYAEIPEKDYIKLDVSKVTEVSDAIYICWPSEKEPGVIVVPNSDVLENKMPTNLYVFEKDLPRDEKGIPRPTRFAEAGCTSVDFMMRREYPEGSSMVNTD